MPNDPPDDPPDDRSTELTATTDRAEIRSWAEARQLVPAYVRADEAAELDAAATGSDGRALVPRDDLGGGYEETDWESFFESMEEAGLVLTYRDPPAEEGPGHYALVDRERTGEPSKADMREVGQPSLEEAPGTDVADTDDAGVEEREGVASELASREVLDVEWADDTVELEVEEAWLVTEEVLADEGDRRRTVERDVTERRRLVAEVVDSEVVESGTANREVIERESLDPRAGGGAAPEDGRGSAGTERAEGIPTETGVTGETGRGGETGDVAGDSTEVRGEPADADRPARGEGSPGTDDPRGTADAAVSEHDEGKPVVDADGNEVGIVTDVRGGEVYVDPDPDIVEKVAAKLGWGQADEDTYTISQADVAATRHDAVELARIDGPDR